MAAADRRIIHGRPFQCRDDEEAGNLYDRRSGEYGSGNFGTAFEKPWKKAMEFANGLDDSEVESVRAEAKGVGNSTTLPKDLITEAEALPVLKDLAGSVGRRLRKAGQKAGMVSVEIKYHTFNQVSHQKQMERQTNQDQDIYQASIELFRELWSGEPIRLLGIRTSKLSEESEPEQLSLFDMKFESEETRKKKKNLKEALKKLEGKYGDGIVKKGW